MNKFFLFIIIISLFVSAEATDAASGQDVNTEIYSDDGALGDSYAFNDGENVYYNAEYINDDAPEEIVNTIGNESYDIANGADEDKTGKVTDFKFK